MKRSISIMFVLLIIVSTAFVSCQYMNAKKLSDYEDKIVMLTEENDSYKTLFEIDDYVRSYYLKDIDEEVLEEGIIAGYLYGLGDRYAYYYAPDDYNAYNEENNGKMTGIGVRVIYDNSYGGIYITSVMDGSPALESGLRENDIIIGVEGEDIGDIGYYEAINRIKDGDEGTTVTLTVARAPEYEIFDDVTVTRAVIDNNTVECELIYGDVGYISISEFNKTTSDELISAVEKIVSEGAKKLIFDVRNNPGGDLNGVAGALDYLLPEGPIIHIVSKQGVEQTLMSDENSVDMPMAVLCNGNTASAGELFTSALKDYEKAVIVGTKTFGKGSMQSVIPLSNGGGVSFTTNRYDPPYSENYDGVGITPDIVIDLTDELYEKFYTMSHDEDIQLQAALKELDK